MIQAQQLYSKNILLFGNASHFLHPISGQGLNLTIRDIGILHDLIQLYGLSNIECLLFKYEHMRKKDHKRTIFATHSLLNTFRSSSCLALLTRGLGMNALQNSLLLQGLFSKVMMGKLSYGSTLMRLEKGKIL